MESTPVVVVKVLDDGRFDCVKFIGKVDIYVVDESCPNDRVYELTDQSPLDSIAELLGDSEIGSKLDARHKAIEARILAYVNGTPYLNEVK